MRRGINLIAILFSMCAISFAQETAKHPIDKALDACLDKNTSTAGMTNCIGEAYGKWDRELNRLYAELMKRLGADGKSTLKEAQVQWLKFRDAEFKLLDGIYDKLDGTMYIPMRASDRMEPVKNRALELKAHLELLKESQ